MIFVTVGMHFQGFERLIKKMDEIASKIDEEVIMQVGSTSYKPKNAYYFDFKVFEQISELIKKARLTVCHGGAGTFIVAFELGTPVIAVPRLKKYNESVNDHQLELVNALAKAGKIIAVLDLDKLENVINNPFIKLSKKIKKNNNLVEALRDYINGLSH